MRRWRAILAVAALALAALPSPLAAQEVPTVLVYTGGGAINQGYASFGLATGKAIEESATLPEVLSGYDCIVLPGNSSWSEGDLDALSSYVNAGGRMLALGEHSGFPGAVAAMNDLSAALDADLSLVADAIDPWSGEGPFPTTSNVDASPFTTGVESIQYAATSEVAVEVGPTAHSLVRTDDIEGPGTTFIGVEQIGSGVFALSGDTNAFSDNDSNANFTGYTDHDNGNLAANICDGADFEGEPDPEVDLSMSKVDTPGPDPVSGGANVAYTIEATNLSTEVAATGVTITDTPPTGAFLATTGSHECWEPPIEGPGLVCFVGDLDPGETASRPLVLTMPTVEEETVVTNTAVVFGGQVDPNEENNTASAETTVVPSSEDEVTGFVPPGGTLTTDNGMTSPNNPVSAQIQVPEDGTAGIYTLGEFTDTSGASKGAVEYTAPENAEEFLIVVSCDESKCPVQAKKDTFLLIKKLNPDGTEVVLSSCQSTTRVRGEPTIVERAAPCVVSVVRNPNSGDNPLDLVWTVKVVDADPIIKAR